MADNLPDPTPVLTWAGSLGVAIPANQHFTSSDSDMGIAATALIKKMLKTAESNFTAKLLQLVAELQEACPQTYAAHGDLIEFDDVLPGNRAKLTLTIEKQVIERLFKFYRYALTASPDPA